MSTSASGARNKQASAPLATGLSDEARKALNQAFDALSDWRNEIAATAERNSDIVFDKMAAAAKAIGWPADFVDSTRDQMQQASRVQLHMMDQVMDIWEQQLKNPGSAFSLPDAMKGMFPAFPGGRGAPAFPGFEMGGMTANPMQFWMQAAEMWQKNWGQAFTAWMEMQQQSGNGRPRGGPFGGR